MASGSVTLREPAQVVLALLEVFQNCEPERNLAWHLIIAIEQVNDVVCRECAMWQFPLRSKYFILQGNFKLKKEGTQNRSRKSLKLTRFARPLPIKVSNKGSESLSGEQS